jgi:Phosphotransferase enzyme family
MMKGVGVSAFPRSAAQITNAFLSDAFDRDVTIVRSSPIGADRSMLGQLVLLELAGAPIERVVAKLHAPRPETLASAQRGGTHLREVNFLRHLAPRTSVRTPECYGVWFDPTTAEFLILLEAVDADISVDQIEGLTVEQVELVIDQIAPLHAAWFGSPDLDTMDWVPRPDAAGRRSNLHAFLVGGWDRFCAVIDDPNLGPDDQPRMHELLDSMLVDLAASPPTLLHGDLRADNLLFTGEEVVLIDWQGLGFGPPGWDLAYLLSQCLTIENRRAHETTMLTRYLTKAAEHGLILSMKELRAGYDPGLAFGLIVAAALCVVSDPTEPRSQRLVRAMGTRAVAALRDVGSECC